jgi:hypothetical protein
LSAHLRIQAKIAGMTLIYDEHGCMMSVTHKGGQTLDMFPAALPLVQIKSVPKEKDKD